MNHQADILVIDDEESIRDSCRQALSRDGYEVQVAENGSKGLELLGRRAFDVVILDLKMPGLSGMEVLERIRQQDPEVVVVVITGYATVESAVDAMKAGAYDYIPKPFTPETLRIIVRRALEKRRLSLENILLRAELTAAGAEAILGNSAAMREVEKLIGKAAAGDNSVLISGEPGAGKQLTARAIHSSSARAGKPFIVVNCGTLSDELFEAELFGSAQAGPEGTSRIKHGRLEAANGGTLYLNEVANISDRIQKRLLQVLEEGVINRGANGPSVNVDVRFVAGTARDLSELVKSGSFDEDLFYKLSVIPINLPALRERPEDIPLLAAHFLQKYGKKRGKSIRAVSEPAMKVLTDYAWPGNVTELENVIERAVVLASGDMITPDDLTYYELAEAPGGAEKMKSLADVEKEHIVAALKASHGQVENAGRMLGIDRDTLQAKLKAYRIEWS